MDLLYSVEKHGAEKSLISYIGRLATDLLIYYQSLHENEPHDEVMKVLNDVTINVVYYAPFMDSKDANKSNALEILKKRLVKLMALDCITDDNKKILQDYLDIASKERPTRLFAKKWNPDKDPEVIKLAELLEKTYTKRHEDSVAKIAQLKAQRSSSNTGLNGGTADDGDTNKWTDREEDKEFRTKPNPGGHIL